MFKSIEESYDNRRLKLPRLMASGRLDVCTEGLLVMTTCPDLATHIETTYSVGHRTYLACVPGKVVSYSSADRRWSYDATAVR